MSTVTINIEGADVIQKALATFTDRLNKSCTRRALVSGGVTVRNECQRKAPILKGLEKLTGPRNDQHRRGQLRRAIRLVYDARNSSRFTSQYVVTVRHGKKFQKNDMDAYYWYFIEFGTKGHDVEPAVKRVLSSGVGGKIYGTLAHIPAQPAHSFMRAGFDVSKGNALQRIMTSYRRNIPLYVTKNEAAAARGER